MNLRILKKKSKQALPFYLDHYSDRGREVFSAERYENYHGLNIRCRHPKKRKSRIYKCECHYHPLKGTPMVGSMSGYYEPEWSESTVFEALYGLVEWDNRPEIISDADWNKILRITGAVPITEEEILGML